MCLTVKELKNVTFFIGCLFTNPVIWLACTQLYITYRGTLFVCRSVGHSVHDTCFPILVARIHVFLLSQIPVTFDFFSFQWLSFCFNHVSFLYTAMIVYRVLFFVPKKTVKMIHTLLQCITIIVIIFGLKVGLSLESQRPQVPMCLKHHDLLLNMLFFFMMEYPAGIQADLFNLFTHTFNTHLVIDSFLNCMTMEFLSRWYQI